ncbi:Calcium-binding acidic-repeat protein precursor (ARP) [Thermococcus sp. 2319x1]|uniref:transglutaminase-like domain-containing protein n=1 Tax=Thermococcus sp. 2319x1 TaxID=1674923 RepID=UPI00073AB9F0|nr:transglutaminase-like domain-containing protein [Thermococcus sp. 2319x1]ALV63237.1 Calcium-binding acidic-repeat protein precursor (ARP) [Thermococcus sp. 2319x1]
MKVRSLLIVLIIVISLSSACIQSTEQATTQQTITSHSPLIESTSTQPEDNDGLTFEEEQKYGTDPFNPDTDGDGISDGEEVNKYKTNPLKFDSDGDGLSDWEEFFSYNTNPLEPDTDKDGIIDGEEANLYKTNPLSKDTDKDNLTDFEELLTYNTNPTRKDTDNDGLYDGEELQLGTNPINEDTDRDRLWDGEELIKYFTDPLNSDSDNDGLLDGEEVIDFLTNPLEKDTDKDYLPDGYEIEIGTDPTYDWRTYYDSEAFKAGLSKLLRSKISSLSEQFTEYNSTLEKVWAILEWIDNTVQYNYTKANYVDVLVINWSTLSDYQRELYANLTKLQAANDTIYYQSGICGDYAILTASLLLESNITPIYMLDITFKDKKPGHAAVAVKIGSEYFVIDQQIPPIHIGSYYWKWVDDDMEISNITFYAIRLNKNGEPIIYSNWTWTGNQIKEKTYHMSKKDIEIITEIVKQKFLEMYPRYAEDDRLKKLAEKDLMAIKATNQSSNTPLPYGFTKGWTLWWYSEYLGLYYHPKIAEILLENYWPIPAFLEDEWKDVIKLCDKFYLVLDLDENNKLVIRDSSGDTFEIPRIIMVLQIAN